MSPFRILIVFLLVPLLAPIVRGQVRGRGATPTLSGEGIGYLTGIVTDEEGRPIPKAKIVLRFLGESPAFVETNTDAKGCWRIHGLGTGDWNVMASAVGYDSADRNCLVRQLFSNPRVPLVLAKIGAPKKDPTPIDMMDKANDLFYLRKYGEAAAAYMEYLRTDPEDVMARLCAGDCYRENGDFQKSIEQFQIVVDMTASDPLSKEILARGLTGLGECFFKTGDLDKAESYFRSSIEKSGDNEIVAYNLGEVCFSRGKIEEAIGFYALAARVAPYWDDPFYKLGYAYLNTAQFEKAREALEKFLTLEPNTERADKVKKDLAAIAKLIRR